MRTVPERVCLVERTPSYLNFDLLIRNSTSAELVIEEVRGLLLDRSGHVLERRIIWQQSLSALAPARAIPANGEAVIFNPILFHALRPGVHVRMEVQFRGAAHGAAPLSLVVEPVACVNRQELRLPVAGRVLVHDGYDIFSHHRRSTYTGAQMVALGLTDNFQRYGLDFVVVDEQGRFYRGAGTRNEDWLGWGRPVRATGSGTVVSVHNDQPDNEVVGTIDRWTDRDLRRNPMSSYGNYVLIDHGGGEFSVVGHLRAGSVRVRRGQRVSIGDEIAQIGNSGASGGVHVHYERRTGPGIVGIRTLPPYFRGLTVVGTGDRGGRTGVPVDSGDILIAR
jgi:murein DD-endopeptidase MepM/ murein hydrolase activator NlpD